MGSYKTPDKKVMSEMVYFLQMNTYRTSPPFCSIVGGDL